MENSTIKTEKKPRNRRKLVISRMAEKAGIKTIRDAIKAGWTNEMIIKNMKARKESVWNARSALKREGLIIEKKESFWKRFIKWFTK